MNIHRFTIALILIALGACVVLSGCGRSETPVNIVPAWQLTQKGGYDGSQIIDPFISWSPDSKSLLFSGCSTKSYRNAVYSWKIGEKNLKKITDGSSANYIDASTFIYMKPAPMSIYKRNLLNGKEEEIAKEVKQSDFWDKVIGFNYNPQRRTIALRFVKYTQFYMPGNEEYDLNGKKIGDVKIDTDDTLPAISNNPVGPGVAMISRGGQDRTPVLKISSSAGKDARVITKGNLGAVEWSPDGKLVAYGDANKIGVVRPGKGEPMIIASFPDPRPDSDEASDTPETPYVSRLSWSPDGNFLAVLFYVPDTDGNYPIIYVLDASKIEWSN